MEGINIYSILITVGLCLLGYVTSYIRTKSKLIQKAGDLINTAEENYKSVTHSGEQKFNAVVTWLYDMTPAPLKIFITKQMISEIVQKVFDNLQEFANKQLDKVVDNIVNKEAEPEDNKGAEDA